MNVHITLLAGALLCSSVLGQVVQRVSLSSAGVQGNAPSGKWSEGGSISADGRYVTFGSDADDLVPGDTNAAEDVFIRDRRSGRTERVSVGPGGVEGDDLSLDGHISADGRFVAFTSAATNLVPGDTNGVADVYVRDLLAGTTERISVDSGGGEADSDSFYPRISADGRFVVFFSYSSNLVAGDTNDCGDIFVRDRRNGTTERVSVSSTGAEAHPALFEEVVCDISADGRFVAFVSDAPNLVPGDTNSIPDVFVRDRRTGTTERVSIATDGTQQMSRNFGASDCSISPDGRYVAFTSDAPQLVPGDTNNRYDVFVHDRLAHTTERVTLDSNGAQVGLGGVDASISEGGRYVLFASYAAEFVSGDTNGMLDVFLRDRQLGTTERVSLGAGGIQGNGNTGFYQISPDGRFVLLTSDADNLIPGDTNSTEDVFVLDRSGDPEFTSLCDPGAAGIVSCPCANLPNGPDRGCDNSAGTGGAMLSAEGGTFLSSDSLVLKVRGENPNALSLLLQGTRAINSGAVYGQGVRCVGGSIRRLYKRIAAAGIVVVPDLDAGDSTISTRSNALGDAIQSGQQRWYQMIYRDPGVLGGCPASSTFNATQAGVVSRAP